MDKKNYEQLKKRLDCEELKLLNTHPVPNSSGLPHPVEILIHNDMDISQVPEDKIPLVHSLLHMFYHNNSGKGLTKENIVVIHDKVRQRIEKHKNFDRLDEKWII